MTDKPVTVTHATSSSIKIRTGDVQAFATFPTAHAPSHPTEGDDGPAETIDGFETGATVTPNTPDRTMPSQHSDLAEDGYGCDIKECRDNLASRDNFIVNKGLWSEFVDQLPPFPALRQSPDTVQGDVWEQATKNSENT